MSHFLRLCYDTLNMTECVFSDAASLRKIHWTAVSDYARRTAALT